MYLPSPGTLVAEKYQLESLLGEGGMGAVYRARHVLMDKPVALKWLRPELCSNADARERLIREARSVARVRHPNVVQVFDVDSYQGALFMVMELLEGETFADLLAKEKLTTQRVIKLLSGALSGLGAAHQHGIIHRDIKPENIFIVRDREHPEGIAKLLDFGISKLEERVPGSARLTQTGLSIGTPLYMSIEQLTSTDQVDQRADIYSFGVLLYHALTGNLPFDGETFAGVVLSIATTTPPPLRRLRPDLSLELDRVVSKAMARHRLDRYASAAELLTALRSIEHTGGHAAQPPLAYPASRTPRPPPGASADLGLDESLAELLASQRATTRRRALIALGAVLLLLGTSIGLMRASRAGSTVTTRPAGLGSATPPSLPRVSSSQTPVAPTLEPVRSTATLPVQPSSHVMPLPTQPRTDGGKLSEARGPAARSEPKPNKSGERGSSARGTQRAADNSHGKSAAVKREPEPPRPASVAAPPRAEPLAPAKPVPTGKSGGLLRADF
jgi:serine/threonine-protein kinase